MNIVFEDAGYAGFKLLRTEDFPEEDNIYIFNVK
jgi:hypothetical protein